MSLSRSWASTSTAASSSADETHSPSSPRHMRVESATTTVSTATTVTNTTAGRYQLASLHSETTTDEGGGVGGVAATSGRRLQLRLDGARLSAANRNLRLWLHVTVIARLTAALSRLPNAGERLRLPPALRSFLEPWSGQPTLQRYVVRRLHGE